MKKQSPPPSFSRYPSPKQTGGVLIRGLVSFFRKEGLLKKGEILPKLFIACSGGVDSVALSVLLSRYGRKIVAPENITLIHVNHGWRGEESDRDSLFVKSLSRKLNANCVRYKGKKLPNKGESWEDSGRKLRKRVFKTVAKRALNDFTFYDSINIKSSPQSHRKKTGHHQNEISHPFLILTAHTKNDLFETKVWRFFTGAYHKLGKGILKKISYPDYMEVRPFLNVTKGALRDFLKEEDINFMEDSSNLDPKYLRNLMRKELIPTIEKIFPGAIESVCRDADVKIR